MYAVIYFNEQLTTAYCHGFEGETEVLITFTLSEVLNGVLLELQRKD